MTPNEKTIAAFETRIRQMILRFQELKKENQELYSMIEITDGDLDGAKERLSKLIRDVNKCIAILSDEEQQ